MSKILPFTDYYINCYLNNMFTLLVAMNESYRLFAYENNYTYKIERDLNSGKNTFAIGYLLDTYLEAYNLVFEKKANANNINDFLYYKIPPLGEIVDLDAFLSNNCLDKDEILFVSVDLFYLIKGSPLYHTEHKSHYTLLCDFGEENCNILDEGLWGYGENTIQLNDLLLAFSKSSLRPSCYYHKIKKLSKFYDLNMQKIIENADRIIKDIQKIDVLCGEILEGQGYFMLVSTINKIINRHIGNSYLFNALHTEKNLPAFLCNEFCEKVKELSHKWALQKNIIMKQYSKCRNINYDEITTNMKSLLYLEMAMWQKFIEAMGDR